MISIEYTHHFRLLSFVYSMRLLRSIPLLIAALILPSLTSAQSVYNGQGLVGGVKYAIGILGGNRSLRQVVIGIITFVTNFLALAAVIAIIVAGIYLIVGQGSDDSKTKAQKMIIYAIVGLIVVLLAKLIVHFVIFAVQ